MSTDTAPLDAELVPDDDVEPVPAPRTSGTAVAVRERRSEIIRPLDVDALVKNFATYQDLIPRLLTTDDYQSAGKDKRFVKKSGWLKIAAAFDLDVQILTTNVERDIAGFAQRAEVWARAIAPSGRAMDGDGYCDINEKRFSDANGRQRLDHDLRTTATTRAMNRAISGLIGMGDPDDETPPPPDTLTSAEYAELVAAFQAAGTPLAPLALHLGCEATDEAVAKRARQITSEQARTAITFLKGLGVPA